MKKNILILCTGNSCRSQMAEGYMRLFAAENANVYSAGIETHGVNPLAVACMLADNVDISSQTSNNIHEYYEIKFDFVITVCDHAKEKCPYFPSEAIKTHHNFPDPAKAQGTPEEIMSQFVTVREQIKAFCKTFVAKNFDGN